MAARAHKQKQVCEEFMGTFYFQNCSNVRNFHYAYWLCVFGVAGETPELFIALHLLHLWVLTLGYKFRARFDGS